MIILAAVEAPAEATTLVGIATGVAFLVEMHVRWKGTRAQLCERACLAVQPLLMELMAWIMLFSHF